jgi:hypothetical protein
MEGVENDMDRDLLQHFVSRASAVLSLHGGRSTNPFTRILLPMALQHEGLMHSVLCLSASHMYSVNPSQEYEDRQAFHRGKALQLLKHDLEQQKAGEGGAMIFEDSNVAQILLHLLHSVCDGNTSGEYRMHMVAAKQIAMNQKSTNPEFQSLFDEFFYYHWIASQITSRLRLIPRPPHSLVFPTVSSALSQKSAICVEDCALGLMRRSSRSWTMKPCWLLMQLTVAFVRGSAHSQ